MRLAFAISRPPPDQDEIFLAKVAFLEARFAGVDVEPCGGPRWCVVPENPCRCDPCRRRASVLRAAAARPWSWRRGGLWIRIAWWRLLDWWPRVVREWQIDCVLSESATRSRGPLPRGPFLFVVAALLALKRGHTGSLLPGRHRPIMP